MADKLNLNPELNYLQDVIGVDRDAKTLATTRTYFNSLRAMLSKKFDISMDKIGYTDEMFKELLGDKVDPDHLFDLRFEIFDERCMGLAPHEFKALILKKDR